MSANSRSPVTFVLVQRRLPSRRRLLLLSRVRCGGRGLVPRVHLMLRRRRLLVHRLLRLGSAVLVRLRGHRLSRIGISRGARVMLHRRRDVTTRCRVHRRRRPVGGRRWLQVLRLPVLRRGLLVLRRHLLLRGRRLLLLLLALRRRRLQGPAGAGHGDHAQQDLGLEQRLGQLRVLHHDLPRLRAQPFAWSVPVRSAA